MAYVAPNCPRLASMSVVSLRDCVRTCVQVRVLIVISGYVLVEPITQGMMHAVQNLLLPA